MVGQTVGVHLFTDFVSNFASPCWPFWVRQTGGERVPRYHQASIKKKNCDDVIWQYVRSIPSIITSFITPRFLCSQEILTRHVFLTFSFDKHLCWDWMLWAGYNRYFIQADKCFRKSCYRYIGASLHVSLRQLVSWGTEKQMEKQRHIGCSAFVQR